MKRIVGIALIATLFACNQAEKKSTEGKDSVKKDSLAISKISIKDEKKAVIFSHYEDLKNALVKSDSLMAQKSAIALEKELATYKGCETTSTIAKKITQNSNLVAQRKEFTALSTDLIALFKTTELSSGIIYIQHCPMANKGDGGDWLSTQKEVRNPYYGDAMLECGSVVGEIKAK
jgi:hypothetical protein